MLYDYITTGNHTSCSRNDQNKKMATAATNLCQNIRDSLV